MILNFEALSETQLVALAQHGDGDAFADLVRRTKASCQRTALSIVKDPDVAEDQVQSAYLNAWRQLHNFRGDAKFSSWISRIVTNQCLMSLRSRRNAPFQMMGSEEDPDLPPDFADLSPGVEHDLVESESRELIRRELKCVPPFLRKALDMVYFADLPIAEAARQLGVSVPAFKSRLARARGFLKQRLVKQYGDAALDLS